MEYNIEFEEDRPDETIEAADLMEAVGKARDMIGRGVAWAPLYSSTDEPGYVYRLEADDTVALAEVTPEVGE